MATRKNRRGGLGGTSQDHLALFEKSYREAMRLMDGLPPTCYGGIRIASLAAGAIAEARAHAWSIPETSVRATISEKMGKLNQADKKFNESIYKMADRCGGAATNWRGR
jgi:hypothetical protein